MNNGVACMVSSAYENYLEAVYAKRTKNMRDVLKVVGKEDKPEYKYGQSIFMVDGLQVVECQVIGTNDETIFERIS